MKTTATNKNTVMKVLDAITALPGITDGKHTIEICNGQSKNWWDHAWDNVTSIEITPTRIKLYL